MGVDEAIRQVPPLPRSLIESKQLVVVVRPIVLGPSGECGPIDKQRGGRQASPSSGGRALVVVPQGAIRKDNYRDEDEGRK